MPKSEPSTTPLALKSPLHQAATLANLFAFQMPKSEPSTSPFRLASPGRYEELRDPKRALVLAQRACFIEEETSHSAALWMYLDTLALAQHKTGDAGAAFKTQQQAIDLMPKDAAPEVKTELITRLHEYGRTGGVYRFNGKTFEKFRP